MKNIRQEVGKRIRTVRKAKGITQEQVGERADLNYKFIGKIERGEVNPSIETLSAIADALNISLSQFFADDWQLPIDYQLLPQDIQLIKDALPFLNQILKISPKDIQLIKETLPCLNQTVKIFTDRKTKELEHINQALIPLNKLFSEKNKGEG